MIRWPGSRSEVLLLTEVSQGARQRQRGQKAETARCDAIPAASNVREHYTRRCYQPQCAALLHDWHPWLLLHAANQQPLPIRKTVQNGVKVRKFTYTHKNEAIDYVNFLLIIINSIFCCIKPQKNLSNQRCWCAQCLRCAFNHQVLSYIAFLEDNFNIITWQRTS